jgi:DNA polymerase bacteriophage-type
MTALLFIDAETRSRTDITAGTDRYTRDAVCLIVTYAFETGPAKIWEQWKDVIPPQDLWDAAKDPEVTFVAHNAAFDRLMLLRDLGIDVPVERWQCTMAQALSHGLPGSLGALGVVCGLPDDLSKLDGYKLIDTFCIPQRATDRFIEPWEMPDEWKRFCQYAIRDTESLRAIYQRLPTHNYVGASLRSWQLDQLVNERGFGFDKRLARAAVSFLESAKVESDDVVRANSGGEVHAASQRNRLLKYLQQKCGIDIESLKAGEVREYLERDDLDPIVRTLLEQRLEAGKSSGAKFKRGLGLVGPEDRIRHWCRWNGAGRTGRDSARGFQPHNLSRPAITVRRPDGHPHAGRLELEPVKAAHIDDVVIPGIYSGAALNDAATYGGPFEACSLVLRHVIVAAKGNELMAGDFKNIESVVTAWLAGETSVVSAFLAAFENPTDKSRDVYRILAGKMLGKRPEDVTDTERQMGKVAILAFGFGGGVRALVNMSIGYQLDLETLVAIVLPTATDEQLRKADRAWWRAFQLNDDFEMSRDVYMACDVLKQQYRASNTAIDQLRKDIDVAVKAAVAEPGKAVYNVGRCKIWCSSSFLIIELPSGRRLLYASPRLETETIQDPDGGKSWTSTYITYSTARGKGWLRERAWSGLFVENVVQAIASDVRRAAMLRIHADTLQAPAAAAYLTTLPEIARTAISLHVHDEIVLDLPKGAYPLERFITQLQAREAWMDGLPVAVDTWVCERYGKR